MGTLTANPVKDVYKKLVWYKSTINSLMITDSSDADEVLSSLVIPETTTSGVLKVGRSAGLGHDVYFYTAGTAAHVGLHWDADLNTEGTLLGGVDDHGVDFKFFGETSGKYIQWDMSADQLILSGLQTIDLNSEETSSGTTKALHIDYDHTGITGSGQSITNLALDIDMNSNSVTHVGGHENIGLDIDILGSTTGTSENEAINYKVTGADTNIGIYSRVEDGGLDIKMVSNTDIADYASIAVGASGATTFTTFDVDAAAANLTFDVDGDINLDADGGEIYLKDNGTTFGEFTTASGRSTLKLYENAGASADDYFSILVQTAGATVISTVDAAGQSGNMIISPDGELELEAADNEAVIVDANCTATTTSTSYGLEIDYDHTGISASGQNVGNRALQINLNSDSPTHVGSTTNYGIFSSVVAATSGLQTSTGLYNRVTGADNNTGIYNYITDGGEDIRMVSSANTSDYCTISTTTNGATTIATVDADAEAADFTLDIDGDITLDADGSQVYFSNNGVLAAEISTANGRITQYGTSGSTDDYGYISTVTNGAMTIGTVDAAAAAGHITLDPDGDLIVSGADVKIDAEKQLFLDGGGDTSIFEHSADQVRFSVGGDILMQLTEGGTEGNYISFGDNAVGFTRAEQDGVTGSTVVNFRTGNKQKIIFGAGDITNLNLQFPDVSGNFTLLLKQDGTGARTISGAYKVYEHDETVATGSATVKFPGGVNPTLTVAPNHVDILSFFWDNSDQIAYGVGTMDFQF